MKHQRPQPLCATSGLTGSRAQLWNESGVNDCNKVTEMTTKGQRLRSGLGSLATLTALAIGSLSACEPAATPPSNLLGVAVRVPVDEDNPLASVTARFIALIANGPGLQTDAINSGAVAYQPSMQLVVPAIPFGANRQIRVEVYDGNELGPVAAVARGASVPVNIVAGSPQQFVHPYVTAINQFANVYSELDEFGDSPKVFLDGAHVGLAAVSLASGKVLITGGGEPKAGAKNPFDPTSYASFRSTVALYDPDTRRILEVGTPAAHLATPRAFHSMGVGQAFVAIAGGVEMNGEGKPIASNKIEFFNMQSNTVTSVDQNLPDMLFGRIQPTVIQLFPGQDYFLIAGGKGNEPCPATPNLGQCAGNTWEIWHPSAGQLLTGQLNDARWHHAGVRVAGPLDGGYLLLIGGENEAGPLQSMEVLQFAVVDSKVLVSNSQVTCPEACPSKPEGFLWNPLSPPLPQPRVYPGALYVPNATKGAYYVYMVGGFTNKEHTQTNNTVDVFDIQTSQFLGGDPIVVGQGRAAPLVASVVSGPGLGEVLVAGGSSNETTPLKSAEFIRLDDSSGTLQPAVAAVDGVLKDGDRTLGAAVGLNTGHVLLLGGAGALNGAVVPRLDAQVWNPY